MKHYPLMVPGAVDSGKVLEVTAPFDFTGIATVELAGEATIELALDTAYRLLPRPRPLAAAARTAGDSGRSR